MANLRLSACFLILIAFIHSLSVTLWAQESESLNWSNRAAQYLLGEKDEILIKVNILGYVRRPGQYLIPRHTDLISLIAFAGGARDGANLSKVHIVRKGLLEQGSNGESDKNEKAEIISVNVKKYLESGKMALVPTLEVGDTILISQSFGNKFSGFLGITSLFGLIAAGASIALIAQRL